MEFKYSYKDYYLKEILANKKGLKPVLGGTGLGKTKGIEFAINELIAKKNIGKKKFIYTTNRHRLISEIEEFLKNENIDYVYLKSDKDIIKDLIKQDQLRTTIENLKNKKFFTNENIRDKVTLIIDKLKDNFVSLNKNLSDSNVIKILDDYINKDSQELINLIKKQLLEIKKANKSNHKKFLDDESIWKLFPFIKYKQNHQTYFLIVTIQKLCRGFFDGIKTIKIVNLTDKIIFMDEFDFLENEILSILAEEPQLREPLEFLKSFYNDFKLVEEKQFWEENDILINAKAKFKKILEDLKEANKKYKLNFPERVTFDINPNADFNKDKKYLLFQNSNTILTERFYLKPFHNSWEIVTEKEEDSIYPEILFKTVSNSIKEILHTFNYLSKNQTYIEDIIREIWDKKNDGSKSKCGKYIEENYLYKKKLNLENELINDEKSFSYENGFNLITFKPNKANFSIDVEYLELITSPEKVISQIAEKNLIFGLSATSDIKRVLNCFDMSWLEKTNSFIKPTKEDIEIIKNIKSGKDKKKNYNLSLDLIDEELLNPELNKILEYIKEHTNIYKNEDEETNDFSQNLRLKRTKKLFNCLEWITNKSKNRNHLVFLDSFRNEQKYFDLKEEDFEEHNLKKLNQFYVVEKNSIGYKVQFNGKNINILFLNAKKALELEEKNNIEFYDKLFTDDSIEKVILVTQYKTASNGVNLKCLNLEKEEIDFEGIHLIEPTHFWVDYDKEDYFNSKKKIFWYLWKLKEMRMNFDEATFKKYLKKNDLSRINSEYKKMPDYYFNSISLFYQALGRIDRKWKQNNDLEITLDEDVKNLFVEFIRDYEEIILQREDYTSTLILNLNKIIIDKYLNFIKPDKLLIKKDISALNYNSINIIQKFLKRIEDIKNGFYNNHEDKAKEIINNWNKLRVNILNHNFDFTIEFPLNKFPTILSEELCYETNLINKDHYYLKLPNEYDDTCFITKDKYKDSIQMNINNYYNKIIKNDILAFKFKEKGFKLEFKENNSKYKLYTPYINQAILKGAIGEEIIKILLNNNNIKVEEESTINQRLFELFDSKINKLPIYIDFKNFSPKTQDKFSLDEWDLNYIEDFDSKKLLGKIKYKIIKIKAITKEDNIKYVLMNLFGDKEDRTTKFYDLELNEVESYKNASIIIIPKVLDELSNYNESYEFKQFIEFLEGYN